MAQPQPTPRGELRVRGSYKICMELAPGGVASVYLAALRGTENFQRVVAVKKMHAHLARRAEFIESFVNEAQVAALVQHPAVCSVIDLGLTGDSYFLAMEYLVGEPLSRVFTRLKNRPLDTRTPRIMARIFAQLCEGLHAAHEARNEDGELLNVVHRDVTPKNLFVLYDGSVRVTDFGIARWSEMIHEETGGVVRDKVAYMAPEHLAGQVVDRRTDIWSMGVVLWELLTGQKLFRAHARFARPAKSGLDAMITPPSRHRNTIPPTLERIVMRALEQCPAARYQSAREMARDLEAFLGEAADTVPAADVAAWLDTLFPGEGEARRSLRAMAYAMDSTGPRYSGPRPARLPLPAPAAMRTRGQHPNSSIRIPAPVKLGTGEIRIELSAPPPIGASDARALPAAPQLREVTAVTDVIEQRPAEQSHRKKAGRGVKAGLAFIAVGVAALLLVAFALWSGHRNQEHHGRHESSVEATEELGWNPYRPAGPPNVPVTVSAHADAVANVDL